MGALSLARCAGALLFLLASCAFAHELPANRLTLVLRDRNHLSLTFFIDYTDALHRALAPQRPLEEFVLMYSAMKRRTWAGNCCVRRRGFQSSTQLILSAGKPAAITNWKWPNAGRVQAMLRERAMQAVVAPAITPTRNRQRSTRTSPRPRRLAR